MHTYSKKRNPGRKNSSLNTKSQEEKFPSRENAVHSISSLQHMIGNQAVQRMLDANVQERELRSGWAAENSAVGDFGRVARRAEKATKNHEPSPTPPQAANNPAPGQFETRTTVEYYPFRATIQRAKRVASRPTASVRGEAQQALAQAIAKRSDAGPGQEHGGEEYQALFESLSVAHLAETAQTGAAAPSAETAQSGPAAPAETAAEAEAAQAEAAVPTAESAQSGTAAPTQAPASAEAAQSETAAAPITIPDIEVPALAAIEKTDAVKGGFTYSGSITRGGATPTGFGVTRSFSSSLTNIVITPKSGTFEVAATFEHPITYQIRLGTGPNSQVDIASTTDSDITNMNYTTVVSDLTPNMGDLNGRPPRTQFWAEDLTTQHELVHANDDKGNGPAAMATVTTWLNSQTAADEFGVKTLLGALPGRFASALLAALSTEDGEKHAYGDGASSYKTRADTIKLKGDKGLYP